MRVRLNQCVNLSVRPVTVSVPTHGPRQSGPPIPSPPALSHPGPIRERELIRTHFQRLRANAAR